MYHDKSTYYHNHCSGVTQGLLLSCFGAAGRYRFEFFRIKEWNLSPRILTKWNITQGAPSYLKKGVVSSILSLEFVKKGYIGACTFRREMHGLGSWGGKLDLSVDSGEPAAHHTLRATCWLIQAKCKWCASNTRAPADIFVQLSSHLVMANPLPTV